LNKLKNISIDEFKKDSISQAATERLLQVAIETTLNIGNHIIASRGYRSPKDYADVFKVLEEEKIIPPEFSSELQQMAKFRNRLVHIYWDIDIDMLYDILQNKLSDFEKFAQVVLREMEKSKAKEEQ
jgi:uncharacterized protein YutE (UPF0331/DUF86 family)